MKPLDLLWFLRCVTWYSRFRICRSWVERLPSTFKPDRMGVFRSWPARCRVAKMQKTKYTLCNAFIHLYPFRCLVWSWLDLFGNRRRVDSICFQEMCEKLKELMTVTSSASLSILQQHGKVLWGVAIWHLVHLTWPTTQEFTLPMIRTVRKQTKARKWSTHCWEWLKNTQNMKHV